MKPQDIVVILKIQSLNDKAANSSVVSWPQRFLAEEIGLSQSEVSAACHRLKEVRLLIFDGRVMRPSLLEFLVHGLKYVFPAKIGKTESGMPTGYATEPLRGMFLASANEPPPVWPDANGTVRGLALQPLYESVPWAAKKDQTLYEYLALVDAIRSGRARERNMAIEILQQRLR